MKTFEALTQKRQKKKKKLRVEESRGIERKKTKFKKTDLTPFYLFKNTKFDWSRGIKQ